MTDEQSVVLTIRFDVDQNSDRLTWSLTQPPRGTAANDDKPEDEYAPGTGTVKLYTGEAVALHVIGSCAPDSGFTSFQIIECCLITRPKVMIAGPHRETRYAPPSPFLQSIGSSYFFENDFSSTVLERETERKITQCWKRTLNIAHTDGSWELSLNLTVRILRGPHAMEVRVFRFDPEVQVGNGTRPG